MIKAKYYDGVTSISHDAEIELWTDRIYIMTKAGNVEWSYARSFVIEKANRHADGKIGFEDTPDARLVFEDRKQFKQVAEKLPVKKQQPIYISVLSYILSIALLLVALFYIIPSLAPALGDRIPQSWEEKLGHFVRNSFTAKFETCTNKEGQAALDKIVAELGKHSGSKYKFNAIVVDEPVMNAFAAPAGSIVIFSGLIDKADDESEIEGVLSHEIGHAVKRHGIDGLMRTLLTTLVIDVITGGGGTAIYLGKEIIEMDYSREAEMAADNYALELLNKTNINPAGLIRFFEKAQKEEDEILKDAKKYTGDRDLSFLSTHPATDTRIKNVKQALNPKRTYSNILTLQEWDNLKTMCK